MFRRVEAPPLLAAAKGQECTLMIPFVCNRNSETVVACHISRPFMASMSGKTSDFCIAFGCSNCHEWIDGRGKGSEHWFEYVLDGMMKTQHILIEQELMTCKGQKR